MYNHTLNLSVSLDIAKNKKPAWTQQYSFSLFAYGH